MRLVEMLVVLFTAPKRRRRDDLRHHPFESVRLLERGLRLLGQLPLALVGVEDDRSILGAVIAELARASVGSMLSSWSRRRSNADRAAHAGAAEAAISVRVLREVLLMIVLGVVALGRRLDLGRDRAVSRRGQLLLKRVTRSLGRALLIVVRVVDARPVLRAGIVSLSHALRRIVTLPEHLQQIVVTDRLRIEHDEHDLVVTGHARADFTIRRVRRRSCGVSDRGAVHAAKLPELPLRAPETAHPDDRAPETIGQRRGEAVSAP